MKAVSRYTCVLSAAIIMTFAGISTAQTTDLEIEFQLTNTIEVGNPEPLNGTSIVDAAVADGRFTTLVAALQATGLDALLDAPGSYTVFAPTDRAFDKLGNDTINALLADLPTLTNILLYHVVSGEVPASAVVNLNQAATVLGLKVAIEVKKNGNVFINDSRVIITDLQTDNGIIHVIDTVLLPDDATELTGHPADLTVNLTNNSDAPVNNVLVRIYEGEDMERLVHQERLIEVGAGDVRPITFHWFPTTPGDRVLTAMVDPFNLIEESNENNNMAQQTITTEAVFGRDLFIGDVWVTRAYNFDNKRYVRVQAKIYNIGTTNAGDVLYRIFLTNNDRRVDDRAVKVITGIEPQIKSGGDYIMIDELVDISTMPNQNALYFFGEVDPKNTVEEFKDDNNRLIKEYGKRGLSQELLDNVEAAINAGDFSTLVTAVQAAGLVDTLRDGDENYTVFAPTDAAFAALGADTINALLADPDTLANILLYHVSPGRKAAEYVLTQSGLLMANGDRTDLAIENGGVFIDDAQIIVTDIFTRNGIIHVIDAVILP